MTVSECVCLLSETCLSRYWRERRMKKGNRGSEVSDTLVVVVVIVSL